MSERSASTFEIYPAIDLRGGRVVRLRQGDFAREQVYDDDPARVALGFAAAGARWIHVVDLDGAREGQRRQASVVGSIVAAASPAGVRIQAAGGLRTAAAIGEALAAGAERVVIGTAALHDAALVKAAIATHGADRIAVALDVRAGEAVGDGWVPSAAGVPVSEAIGRLGDIGVGTLIVTAIERDGLLGGPNLDLLADCLGSTDAEVLASGGIRSVADLEAVRRIRCSGAIVGRALYDGALDLATAINALADRPG